MKIMKLWSLMLLTLCLIFLGCQKSKTEAEADSVLNPQNRILIVYSTNLQQEWSRQIEVGTRHFLFQDKFDVEVITLDIFPGTPISEREEAGRRAMEKFNSFKPGVVLAIDDPAQKYFAASLAARLDVNVVFCGVKADAPEYNYPNFNVTGVLVRPQFKKAIDLLAPLLPEGASYTVLTDNSEESNYLVRYLEGINLNENITIVRASNYSAWQEAVFNLSGSAVILLGYNHVADVEGAAELMAWTAENLTIPSIAFEETAIEKGILLGIIESGFEQGSVASIYTSWISAGKQPNQIPLALGKDGLISVNKATAARLKLDVSGLKIDKLIEN